MTAIRAILFDIGGVLEITPTTGWQARWESVLERLDVAPEEVVFVDDLRANIEAAGALGMRGVLFTGDTTETLRELRALLGR